MAETQEKDKKSTIIDYSISVVIGIATILGALAAYYSSIWGGTSSGAYNKAIIRLSEANTHYLEALTNFNEQKFDEFQDDFVSIQYEDAVDKGDSDNADYWMDRFSDEYKKYYAANTEESEDSAYDAYCDTYNKYYDQQDSLMKSAIRTFGEIQETVKQADKAGETGDHFTLLTVFFTIVLFFGGITTLTQRFTLKIIYATAAFLIFCFGVYSMFSAPLP